MMTLLIVVAVLVGVALMCYALVHPVRFMRGLGKTVLVILGLGSLLMTVVFVMSFTPANLTVVGVLTILFGAGLTFLFFRLANRMGVAKKRDDFFV